MHDLAGIIERIAVFAVPVVFAVTLHEAAHGWMADRLGDSTARRAGRLTLNPVKHVDPVGTVLVPLVLLWLGGFIFGWAKPVPVTPSRLRHPERDMMLVALAGPGANLAMALAWALVVRFSLVYHVALGTFGGVLYAMGLAGILINTILLVLNLLPLPPLDGGRVLVSILPRPLALRVARVEPFGLLVLIALLATGLLGQVIGPPIVATEQLLHGLAGLSRGGP